MEHPLTRIDRENYAFYEECISSLFVATIVYVICNKLFRKDVILALSAILVQDLGSYQKYWYIHEGSKIQNNIVIRKNAKISNKYAIHESSKI